MPYTPEGVLIADDISPDNWEGFVKAIKKPIPVDAVQLFEPFSVKTKEGVMTGKAGDFLMIGIHGEKYPCDCQVFIDSYDVQL